MHDSTDRTIAPALNTRGKGDQRPAQRPAEGPVPAEVQGSAALAQFVEASSGNMPSPTVGKTGHREHDPGAVPLCGKD